MKIMNGFKAASAAGLLVLKYLALHRCQQVLLLPLRVFSGGIFSGTIVWAGRAKVVLPGNAIFLSINKPLMHEKYSTVVSV
jgi:hypothetical protein